MARSPFILAAALVSCAGPGDTEPETPAAALPGAGKTCPAAEYQWLVGEEFSAVSLPEDLKVRVIRPGQAVTMDYMFERMNIHLDEDGVVLRVACG